MFRAKLIPAKKKMGDKVPKKLRKKPAKQVIPSDVDSEPEQVWLYYSYKIFLTFTSAGAKKTKKTN